MILTETSWTSPSPPPPRSRSGSADDAWTATARIPGVERVEVETFVVVVGIIFGEKESQTLCPLVLFLFFFLCSLRDGSSEGYAVMHRGRCRGMHTKERKRSAAEEKREKRRKGA